MDVRSVFAVIAVIFLLWLIRTWIQWDIKAQKVKKSRHQLRERLSDAAFIERVRPAVQYEKTAESKMARQPYQRKGDESEADEIRRLEGQLRQMSTELDQARSHLSKSLLENRSPDDSNANLSQTVEKLNTQLSAQKRQLQRQVHAAEQLEKVRKQMFDKHRELEQVRQSNARTEESLAQYRSGAQKAAMLEQKYSTLHTHSEKLDNELSRLRHEIKARDGQIQQLRKQAEGVSREGEQPADTAGASHASKSDARDQLRRALEATERTAAQSGQSDLEIRRLKSELESLSLNSSRSTDQINSIQQRLLDQIAVLGNKASPDDGSGRGQGPDQSTGNSATPQPLYEPPTYQDNLKKISGIGPVMEKTLNVLGVTTFKQLAAFTQHDIEKVSAAIDAFPGRIERDEWVAKAQEQQKKKYGESV